MLLGLHLFEGLTAGIRDPSDEEIKLRPVLWPEAGIHQLFPFMVDLFDCRANLLAFWREKQPDGPTVAGVGNSFYVPGIFQFCYRPRNGTLVNMEMPGKGILHHVLLFYQADKDGELAGREPERTEPFI